MNKSKKEKDKVYYENGVNILLKKGENISNYHDVLKEYNKAYSVRHNILNKLDVEIKKIKKIKV